MQGEGMASIPTLKSTEIVRASHRNGAPRAIAVDLAANWCGVRLKSLGANIVDPLKKMPWGLTQFTVDDLDGNRFCFDHD
jgi:uncharacterized glyoxalase superfamily protein PhnB